MAILKLTDILYISPQLTETDAQEAARLGIKTVVCNRPDGEEENQPAFSQVRQWLQAAGINQFHHQPVTAPEITAADAAAFQAIVEKAQQPVLAYCRTGTRSALLWAYRQVSDGLTVKEAVAAAARAGVNLSAFATRLNEAAEGR